MGGTCDWRLTLVGSICRWNLDQGNDAPNHPYCDDEEPELVANTCPSSETYNCDLHNSGCGCGSFTAPSFTDDKGAVNLDITATLNGVDVVDVANLPNQQLSLGANNIVYTAEDVHGQTATCSFTITYTDTTGPLVYVDGSSTDGCPDDIVQGEGTQLCVTSGTTYDSYSVSWIADDECVLDTKTYTTQTVDTSDAGLTQLTANANHAFSFTAYDASNNPTPCTWNVYVADCAPPEITCEGPYNARIQQGSTTAVVNFVATGTDSSGVEPTVVFTLSDGTEIDTDYAFSEGLSQTVTATATDDAGLTDTCDIEVNIYEAYPEGTFEAALIGAIISQSNNPNGYTAGDFNAEITFLTATNIYHSVTPSINPDHNGNYNAEISNNGISPVSASCALTDAVCREDWKFDTEFTDCGVQKKFSLIGTVTCDVGADNNYVGEPACEEANTPFLFDVTFSATNYCWHDLAEITVDTDFITVPLSVYNAWTPGTSLSNTDVYGHEDGIAGIVFVTSNDVETSSVEFVQLSKTHYESDYTTPIDTTNAAWTDYDLLSNVDQEAADYASFTYTESSVPLETTHYIRYSAKIQLSYTFGGSRRVLLATAEDVLREEANADIVVFQTAASNALSSVDDINPDDAILVLKLQNCVETSTTMEDAFESIFATSLRISDARVKVQLLSNDDDDDECFIVVTVSQLACDTYTIEELITDFESIIKDPFSEVHGTIYKNENIPQSYIIDNDVFFVQQYPATIYTETHQGALADMSRANDLSNSNDMDATLFVIIGIVTGIVASGIVLAIMHKKKNTSEPVKFQPVRKASIAVEDSTSVEANSPQPTLNHIKAMKQKKTSTANQAMSSLLNEEYSDDSSSESEVEEGLEGLY